MFELYQLVRKIDARRDDTVIVSQKGIIVLTPPHYYLGERLNYGVVPISYTIQLSTPLHNPDCELFLLFTTLFLSLYVIWYRRRNL